MRTRASQASTQFFEFAAVVVDVHVALDTPLLQPEVVVELAIRQQELERLRAAHVFAGKALHHLPGFEDERLHLGLVSRELHACLVPDGLRRAPAALAAADA